MSKYPKIKVLKGMYSINYDSDAIDESKAADIFSRIQDYDPL
jgi:hypothetical protein